MKKIKTISSIVKCKCPGCRDGNLFEVQNPYNLMRFFRMPENCDNCGIKFEMEPGFWYGAMYFSYLLGFILTLPIIIMLLLSRKFDFLAGIIIVSVALILLVPILFRYSRTFWIYIFVPYDP